MPLFLLLFYREAIARLSLAQKLSSLENSAAFATSHYCTFNVTGAECTIEPDVAVTVIV